MKKSIIYAISVCLFSWAVFGVFYLACGGDPVSKPIAFALFKSVYMLFPMVVAVALQLIGNEPLTSTGLLNFKISRTWLAALLMPLLAVVICIPLSAVMPGVKLEFGVDQIISEFGLDESGAAIMKAQMQALPPALFVGFQVLVGLIAGCTVNAVFAFGEEYGWRNYLVNALDGVGFWGKSLFVGLVWGIWHAPLILLGHNYPQHPVMGVGMMCVLCILLGAIELYFVLRTGSVFPAAIIHGTFNALSGLVLFFILGGNDLTVGLTGIAGFITMALIMGAIVIYDRFLSSNPIILKSR